MKFFDDNTRSWWTPITGGANVPALNDLLAPHNITLGERILQGTANLGDHKVTVSDTTSAFQPSWLCAVVPCWAAWTAGMVC
jgi:membrane-bound transcription factor site-1 protease